MKDTSDAIEAKFREMILARSPSECLAMACGMFATAKELVRAGILQESGDLDPTELRRRIFLRLYGDDFEAAEKDKIIRLLATWRHTSD